MSKLQGLVPTPSKLKQWYSETLLDPWMSMLRPAKVDPQEKLGVMGTAVYGGFILSPEKNPKLQGIKRYETYADIFCNVSIVAAGVRYFLNVITKSAWKIEPPNDSAEAKKYAEIAESMLDDMEIPWHRIVRKAVMYKFYGYSLQEWTAKRRSDGNIGLLTIESRPQRTIERWDVDKDGVVLGVIQRSPQTALQIYIPRSKMIYLVDDSLNDSPEGLGLFRHIVEVTEQLRRFEQLEGYGYETDLRGIPIGRAPLQALRQMVKDGIISEVDYQKIMNPMQTFIENHIRGPRLGLLLDSMTYLSTNEAQTPSNVKEWDMELLKGGSSSLKEISSAIQRKSGEVARILGVEGLLLGSQGRGSQALSRDKSDNFFMVVDSALKEVASTFSKDVIDPIWWLNGWPQELKPRFKTDSIQLRDVQSITTALQEMAQAGAILAPDDPAINEVRDLLGLSRTNTTLSMQDVSLGTGTGSAEN